MKWSLIILLFLVSLSFSIITIFFRDRFLFYLYGYDSSLLNNTTVEAFEAYKSIYNGKLFLILASISVTGVSALITRRHRLMSGNTYVRIIFLVEIAVALILLIILLMYFALPKRLM